jgi:hypothetical protein
LELEYALSGGDKLEETLKEIAAKLTKAGTLRVGFLEDATYPNGIHVATVAAIQEYGAPKVGIPPRPYFRRMIAAKSNEWPGQLIAALKASDNDTVKALNMLGASIAGQLRESIADLTEPPLSEVTLMVRQIIGPNGTPTFKDVLEARRRVAAGERASGVSTKPLVWTGHLLGSVDFEVSEK